jgi:HD superfamily phosphohydrolase
MIVYKKLLENREYLELTQKIESIRFITDNKWDWEHGLGHYKRVANYVKKILTQLHADNRTIDLGMTAALLHDIGLSRGDKVDHAIESGRLFAKFIKYTDVTIEEKKTLRQAIIDHSNGKEIRSLIGLALVLADKLDVTYHRTKNSSIQDYTNKEIQKIKNVDIEINDTKLIVRYTTEGKLDMNIFSYWVKAITVPQKIANYLNKEHHLVVNGKEINCNSISL